MFGGGGGGGGGRIEVMDLDAHLVPRHVLFLFCHLLNFVVLLLLFYFLFSFLP